jgi:hypothetical protein
MEIEQRPEANGVNAQMQNAKAPAQAVIGSEQVKKFTHILQEYKTGKAHTEHRIIASENWWKLRNTMEEERNTNLGRDGGYKSV